MKMKRTLSLVLAIILAFGSFTFASPAADHNTVGNELKALGVIKGDDSGNLMTGEKLTREQAVVVLVRMMGKEADAQSTPAKTDFTDVPEDNYYAPYIAYAKLQGWTKGTSETTFGLGTDVTTQQVATFMLRALGYTDVAYENAMTEAANLGLTKDVSAAATDAVVRGEVFVMMKNTLYTNAKDAKINLVYQLGLIAEPEAPKASVSNENIKDVKAIAANQVEVILKEAVTAVSAANFNLTEKGADKAIEIKDAKLENATTVVLTTDVLTATKAYTVNGVNFTAIAKLTDKPVVKKMEGKDLNKFAIEFSAKMDFDKATDVANYTFSNGLKVVKVELVNDADSRAIGMQRKVVNVYTDAAKTNRTYNLTIENLTNTDGVKMDKITRVVSAREDRTAPTLTTFKVQNNRMIILSFNDETGLNKASAEDVANYTIDGLGIVSAKAYDTKDDEKTAYDTVVLTTDSMTAGKAYKLVVANVIDDSINANKLTSTSRSFAGIAADTQAPTVVATTIVAPNNNEVKLFFNDNNAMSKDSVEDVANYVIKASNGDVLPVLSAKYNPVDYPDTYAAGEKYVVLTTAAQEIGKAYTIEVKGVQDEFANALKPVSGTTYAKYNFQGARVDVTPPAVKEVAFVDKNTVRVTFTEDVSGQVNDPTNFSLNGDLGQAVKSKFYNNGAATLKNVIELTVADMAPNKAYTLTVNALSDIYGNETVNAKGYFVATRTELDKDAPKITYIYAANKNEIVVNFDEAIDNHASAATLTVQGGNPLNTVTFAVVGFNPDKTALVYAATGGTSLTNAEYIITSLNGGSFNDGSKNSFNVLPTATQEGYDKLKFQGNSSNPDAAKVLSVYQTDVRTIKVVFDKPVIAIAANAYINKDEPKQLGTELTIVNAAKLNTTDKLLTQLGALSTYAQDATNTAFDTTALKNYNDYIPSDKDETKPYIVSVTSPNMGKIEVRYSEALDSTLIPTYQIYNYKADAVNVKDNLQTSATAALDGNDKTLVIVTYSNALAFDKTYYIKANAGAKDLSLNQETPAEFAFSPSGVIVKSYIKGVTITNKSEFKVLVQDTVFANTSISVVGKDTAGIPVYNYSTTGTLSANNKTLTVNCAATPLYSDYEFIVTVNLAGGLTESYIFKGAAGNDDANLAKTSIAFAVTTTSATTVQLSSTSYTNAATVKDATPATVGGAAVNYATSDATIATVDALGVVTFKKAGTVVITASFNGGLVGATSYSPSTAQYVLIIE